MRNKRIALFGLMLIATASLSGCIYTPVCGVGDDYYCDEEGWCGTEDPGCEYYEECIDEEEEYESIAVGDSMTNFTLMDHNGTEWNSSNLSGDVWVSYFTWAGCDWDECIAVLDAIDHAIPDDRLLIFNADSYYGEPAPNMSEWKLDMEEGIGHDLNRPFINAPDLAIELNIYSVIVFIDHNGTVSDVYDGLSGIGSQELEHRYDELVIAAMADSQ